MQKAGAGAFGAARSSIKALKESVNSVNSKTGLPPRLLELFQPRPSLPTGAEIKKRKPKLPYTGLADLVQHFAAPGDAEYEPEPPSNRPQEPRLCANPELPSQARLDSETKAEKKIRITQWKKEEVRWAGMHGWYSKLPVHRHRMHATPNLTSILHVAQAQAQVDAAIKLWEPSKDSRIQVHDVTVIMDGA